MNVHVPPPGLPRDARRTAGRLYEAGPWRFTVRDVERMVETGILREKDRVELIDGELVTMAPKGDDHESAKDPIAMRLARLLREPYMVSVETTFRLSPDTYVEPDLLIYDGTNGRAGLSPTSALLAIEIAVTSLPYDLGRKPGIYARHGVRELWVVDVKDRRVHVHREPGPDGYASIAEHGWSDPLTPSLLPDLTVSVAELVEAGS